jgi:hypothetical protein
VENVNGTGEHDPIRLPHLFLYLLHIVFQFTFPFNQAGAASNAVMDLVLLQKYRFSLRTQFLAPF